MLIKLTKSKIHIEPNSDCFTVNNHVIWVKGHFFFNNIFYNNKGAAEFISQFKTVEQLTDNIGKLNGIFTILIANQSNNEIIIANDRFGFGHLFYTKNNNELIICDNFWKLATEITDAKINKMALYEILRLRYVLRGHTIIEEINEIEPSSIYTINYNTEINITRKEYWNFNYKPTSTYLEDAEIKVHTCLNNIIERYSKNIFKNSKIGLNLTGGIDSRYILSLLLKNKVSPNKISTFTFGIKSCQDIKISSQIARLTKTKHSPHIFSEPFYDFFEENNIDNLLHEIGFSSFYFQAYGTSKLLPQYKDIDYLLTGSDGFFIGLMTNKQLFNLENISEFTNYILRKNATILNSKDISNICNFNTKTLEQQLIERIRTKVSESTTDYQSTFFDWTIKNRLGKYILSIHEMLNRDTTVLHPFYDYEFIDLMSILPFETLLNQNAYVNAMYKYSFTNENEGLANIPVENRRIYYFKNKYRLERKNKPILQKIIFKLFALPEYNYTYPMYKTFKHSKNKLYSIIAKLIENNSQLFNSKNIIKLTQKNSKNEHFFRYGLIAILSVFRLEKIMNKQHNINN